MTSQINLRLSENLLNSAKNYANEYGYSNVQDFIKEIMREKLFEEGEFTKEELILVNELKKVSDQKKLYGTEKDLFNKFNR